MTGPGNPDKRTPKPTTARGRLHRALMEGAPDLMQDADFALMKLRRQRSDAPRRKPDQREKREVQQPLVVYLRKHLPAGSLVTAIPIQPVSENHRFAMVRDGVQFGWPDVEIVIAGPRYFHIECKHPDGGALSESQKHTQAALVALGVPVLSECRSVEQAVTWLREQGVLI